jgi:aspartyl-tRNA(Asn)/glutamyl-tRNA(Gln) amidotransferase subunit B
MVDPRRRLSSIDLNRAGTGLMEIVSKPDMRYASGPWCDRLYYSLRCTVYYNRSPEEAGEYVRTLQAVLRSVAASDGNMEQVCKPLDGLSTRLIFSQGSLRCDVNVSVNRQGQAPGTRCEIKNLNSIRFMIAAIGNSTSVSIFVIRSIAHYPPFRVRGA